MGTERVRPVPAHVNASTEREKAQAARVQTRVRRKLEEALELLGTVEHPLEGARVTGDFLDALDDAREDTNQIRRQYVLDAYAQGRAEYGKYGYGAIADQLGLSRARVQQIVNDMRNNRAADTKGVERRRAADAARARKKGPAGLSQRVAELAADGLNAEEIADELNVRVEYVKPHL